MSYPKYQLANRLKTSPSLPSEKDEEELWLITAEVFKRWSEQKGFVLDKGQQVILNAELEKVTEGMSAADVYQLTFLDGTEEVFARFIIRIHKGTEASAEAKRERVIAHDIATGKYIDTFSAQVEEEIPRHENIVVYRHADDQFGKQSVSLQRAILDLLENPTFDRNTEKAETMSSALQDMMRAVVATYDDFQPPVVFKGEKYFEKLRPHLLPEILIEASDRQVDLINGALSIANEDGTQPSQKTSIVPQDLEFIQGMLNESKDNISSWLKVKVSFERLRLGKHPILCFYSGRGHIWIRVGEENYKELALETNREYYLQFKFNEQMIFDNKHLLQNLGYKPSSIISLEELRDLCKNEDEMFVGARHSDLHCNNVRWGLSRAKVIDLSSRDTELLAISEARLEVSIWDNISNVLKFEEEEIWAILKNLEMNQEPNSELLSEQAYILNSLLLAIRRGANEAHERTLKPGQVALAYVVQILLYQRYHVEKNERVKSALDIISTYWINRFRNQIISGEINNLEAEVLRDETLSLDVNNKEVTLYDLWNEALRSQNQEFLDARVETFLLALSSTQMSFVKLPLTDFQQRVLEAAQNPDKCLFLNDNNVILAAPTSSGKSTVAEMFLLRPYLLNNDRRCAVYIAPTRALTQAKYRELKERFSTVPHLADSIVLSTGENTEDDWRISHGQFAIACLVYEKANILFSQNLRLLGRLGCIVVDEFHMLSDLDRGPILEMALTKASLERSRVDKASNRAPNQETIRIIAITTEGEPDESIRSFLASWNFDTFKPEKPIVVISTERPVSVRHWIVLPPIHQDKLYETHLIGTFTPRQQRVLPTSQRQALNKSLYHLFQQSQHLKSSLANVKQESEKRVVQLVVDILQENPRGRQIIVFIPSRSQIEDSLSGALRNTLTREWKGDKSLENRKKQFYKDLVKPIELSLEKAEDKRMSKLVRNSAELGILIHHSDIDKGVRTEIEQICSTITENTYSRVILATETLSYGVNLAIHDVILLGTEFYTRTRFRETRQEALSQCAYHNMIGRAGRLGRMGSETANVYIIVARGDNPYRVIQDYYSDVDREVSTIFVSDDRARQQELKDRAMWFGKLTENQNHDGCEEYRLLEAKDLSYPFVRSILDGLRHLNAIHGHGNRSDRAAVRVDILLSLFEETLYVEQFVKKYPDESTLFRCAVLRVLESCASKPLDLVSNDNALSYSITPRGEAVIDTGTELQTVEPLLEIVDQVRNLWERQVEWISFPVELLILCILAQNEVLRDFIRYTPEGKTYYSWPDQQAVQNREHVFEQFVRSLRSIIPLEMDDIRMFASELRELTNNTLALLGYEATYKNGETDSVLRFFNGIIAWIQGEDRSKVYDLIEGENLSERFRGKMERLSQFTETLNYKIVFLAKILTTGRYDIVWLQPEKERELRLLALRVRLGCILDAIPLFWPWSSGFSRQEAVELINSDITPVSLLLSPELPKLSIPSVTETRLRQLISDLEKFAGEELDKLHAEMTVGQQGQTELHREAISQLWEQLTSNFKSAILLFRNSDKSGVSFDTSLREVFGSRSLEQNENDYFELTVRKPHFDEHYRIQVQVNLAEKGMTWYGQKLTGTHREDENFETKEKQWINKISLNVIGVQFRANWACSVDGHSWAPFEEVLRSYKNHRHLVIVPLPWLPSRERMPEEVHILLQNRKKLNEFSTTIITPIAFATMATFIMRDFVSSEDCIAILNKSSASNSLYNRITTKDILRLADNMLERQVPAIIREKIVELFEVTEEDSVNVIAE